MDFAARDAVKRGESSVAVFVTSTTGVVLERTRIAAGAGMDGDDGMLVGSNHFGESLNGNPATGVAGGGAKACMCPDGTTTSIGGLGGDAGLSPDNGDTGLPNYLDGGGRGGDRGTLTGGACWNGGVGSPAPAGADAEGAMILGAVSATAGWLPNAGANGVDGLPGQGGGGGGGTQATIAGGGGGGACGGCGGLGAP